MFIVSLSSCSAGLFCQLLVFDTIYEILMHILPFVCYQYVIKADSGGMVEKVLFSPGESVAKNTTLVRMKDDE